jgi:anti-anti-sigma factor
MTTLDGTHNRDELASASQPALTVTVRLAGEYDLAREGELVAAVVALDMDGPALVRLDVSEVTFVESCGLRGMLMARSYLLERGCWLALVHPTDQLRRLLRMSGLEEILPVVDAQT